MLTANANKSNEAKKHRLIELFTLWNSNTIAYFKKHDVFAEISQLSYDDEFINYLIDSGTLTPVAEKLPDFDKKVIAYDGHYLFESTYIECSCWNDGKPGWNGSDLRLHVTHWMPLPEPPKEVTG